MLGKPAEECNLILCHLGELTLTFRGWIDWPSQERASAGDGSGWIWLPERCLWMDLAAKAVPPDCSGWQEQ